MRVGVFGGTFDPVHLGHLLLAEQCREQGRLDEVWFVPAARPPHKQDQAVTPFAQRVEMLTLAVAGHSAFRINELEKDRAGPSYTVDTLEVLRRQYPADEFFLLMGSDCLPDLPHWREPVRIAELAGLLIVSRPGKPVWPRAQLEAALRLPPEKDVLRQQTVSMPQLDISSSDLRQRAGSNRSIRFFVPRAVQCYIEAHRLYRVDGPAAPEGAGAQTPGEG